MVHEIKFFDPSGTRLLKIASLLTICFLVFKPERYYVTPETIDTPHHTAIELITPHSPWNSLPQLIIDVPPTVLKKYFTGSGSSNKFVMEKYFKDYSGIDLYNLLGIKRSVKEVPKPIEDLVDAFALTQLAAGITMAPKKDVIVNELVRMI